MSKKFSEKKVALVTDSLWSMAGANKVLDAMAEIYPNSNIYSLFGEKKYLSENLQKHHIYFSFLNKLPFIKHIYRYTFHLWPVAIEQFDFSEYDLVISNSSSVAHGVITPLECKHVLYLNSNMRYVWDLSLLYTKIVKFGFLKRIIKEFFINFNRIWDVVAAQRPEVIISNSEFVAKRVKKYWDRESDFVIHPPVEKYDGRTVLKRDNYYVAGAPFEPNKRGDFLLECASSIGFNLKLIGNGSMKKKLERKYRKFKNIEFLDRISDEEKWKVISNAKGFLVVGIEDYGIFCAEAISCGTPVLAYNKGGSLEIVKDGEGGMFFKEWDLNEFRKVFKYFDKKTWNYDKVRNSLKNVNSKESFKKKIKGVLVE